jgi:hypothetical protein
MTLQTILLGIGLGVSSWLVYRAMIAVLTRIADALVDIGHTLNTICHELRNRPHQTRQ